MKLNFSLANLSCVFAVTAIAVLLAGCAPSVKVRSDADPGVDMSRYQI